MMGRYMDKDLQRLRKEEREFELAYDREHGRKFKDLHLDEKITTILWVIGFFAALWGIVAGLAYMYETYFGLHAKAALKLGIVTMPLALFILYLALAIVVFPEIETWLNRRGAHKSEKR